MLTNPESHAAEEYRRLCFNIEWSIRETLSGPCKTIQVTSALPREGKTITAVNLATTLARNHRVLLIDANFRNPSIHKVFGISDGPGLSDLIMNSTTPDLYVPAGSPNLSVLPAGLSLAWPADVLSSKPMDGFIGSVKESSYFEYAVFDVPASAAIPDAPIIAAKVAGLVWVVEELQTSKDIVGQALTRITNPSILGVVLNKSEQHSLPKRFHKVWKDYQKAGSPKKRKRS
jgi:capsular exopolysaccharide synthesis family protein